MNPQGQPHTEDDPAPAEASTTEESDTAFGTRMRAAEAEAERFGDPAAARGTTPPDPVPDGATVDDAAAAAALRSYADSQPQPPTTEPLIDPLGEGGRPYN